MDKANIEMEVIVNVGAYDFTIGLDVAADEWNDTLTWLLDSVMMSIEDQEDYEYNPGADCFVDGDGNWYDCPPRHAWIASHLQYSGCVMGVVVDSLNLLPTLRDSLVNFPGATDPELIHQLSLLREAPDLEIAMLGENEHQVVAKEGEQIAFIRNQYPEWLLEELYQKTTEIIKEEQL